MNLNRPFSNVVEVLVSRLFVLTFVSLLSIGLSMAYVVSEPWSEEEFLVISTLGNDMKADNLFPIGNSSISLNDNVSWYVSVYNHMGHSEHISVKIYLHNNATSTSNESLLIQKHQIFESQYLVRDNSSLVIPVNWTILQATRDHDYVTIKSLIINNEQVDNLEIRDLEDNGFSMLIELWRYNLEGIDPTLQENSNKQFQRYGGNQIWFKIKA